LGETGQPAVVERLGVGEGGFCGSQIAEAPVEAGEVEWIGMR